MQFIQAEADLRDDIAAFMAWRRQGVTFAELVRMLPQLKGSESFLYPGFDSILIWRGLSAGAITALRALIDEERLVMTPSCALTYVFFDRFRSNLPIAAARRNYRTLRWWPMTLGLGGGGAGLEAAEERSQQDDADPVSVPHAAID